MKPDMPPKLWPRSANIIDDLQLLELSQKLLPLFSEIVEQEKLGKDILSQLKDVYIPLAASLAHKHTDTPIVVGINGAQGSGKSTLGKILKSILLHGFNKSVIILSIDDLYLSRQQREQLGRAVHPLLKVRGVPGTHDVELGGQILQRLVRDHSELLVKIPVKIPVFDKAQDDLLPQSEWIAIDRPADIILFEGWCVAAQPQSEDALKEAINDLEQSEDEQGEWRNYVNKQLAGTYQTLFGFIDYLVMLKVPDMESVFEWRSLQEQKLKDSRLKNNISTSHVMSAAEIARFIMHYERITRGCLAEMPDRADILLELNYQHQVCGIRVGA